MDLLDRIRKKAGDPTQARQLGVFKFERGEAPSLLLARMFPSLTSAYPS
jgi:hypothetical protein